MKKLVSILVSFICIFFLFSCDFLTSAQVSVSSITVEDYNSYTTYNNFNLNDLTLKVSYSNNTKKNISFDNSLLTDSTFTITSGGDYQIDITYEEYNTKLNISILPGISDSVTPIKDLVSDNKTSSIYGVVLAKNSSGFILADGTGLIYVLGISTCKVGNMVKVSGETDSNNYVKETRELAITDSTERKISMPTTISYGANSIENANLYDYVSFEGNLDKSTNIVSFTNSESTSYLPGFDNSLYSSKVALRLTGFVIKTGSASYVLVTSSNTTITSYLVTFLDSLGTTISEQLIYEGGKATEPSIPSVDNKVFKEWDKQFSNVTENLTIRPVYIDIANFYNTFSRTNGGSTYSISFETSGTNYYIDGALSKTSTYDFSSGYLKIKIADTYQIATINATFDEITLNDVVYNKVDVVAGLGFLNYPNCIPDTTISSKEELRDYIEYTAYNNIGSSSALELTIDYTPETNIATDITTESLLSSMPVKSVLVHIESSNHIKLYMQNTDIAYASLSAGTTDSNTQLYQAGYKKATGGDTSYNDFKINQSTKSYNCETSDQLFYLLEHGYKPICKDSSVALTIYNKALTVLRENVNSDMTDYEKVKAIYEYIIYNVCYDYDALSMTNSWYLYKGYYLEGVFLDGRAVCDGISKAFSLLCNIEGIKSYRVYSNTTGTNHAWNIVNLNDNYYIVDATWGEMQTQISSVKYGIIKYDTFLISDQMHIDVASEANKACAVRFNHSEITISNDYGYYDATEISSDTDLKIDSQSELNSLFSYLKSLKTSDSNALKNKTYNFSVSFDYGSSISDELQFASFSIGLSEHTSSITDGIYITLYLY